MAKYIDAERYINNLRELRTGDKDTVYEYYDDGIDVAISEAAIFPVVDISRWIPVTERLPEQEGQYLVSGKWANKNGEVWICDFIRICDIRGWCNDAGRPAVQAWMPLPTPYKGGEEE